MPSSRKVINAGQKRRYEANRQRLRDYLATKHCVDCGETDMVVLDFDHRDPAKKKACVTRLLTGAWARVLEEAAKCEIRCANCHRRKTARELNWHSHRHSYPTQ